MSGSAATSDTAPSVESSLKKKPLKSALKKPKNPVLPPVLLDDENDDVDSPDKSLKYVSFLFIFMLVIFFLDFESIIKTTPRGLVVWAWCNRESWQSYVNRVSVISSLWRSM